MTSRKSTSQRKKEIIDSALEIIYEKGFAFLTMRKLAQLVGISEAAMR